MRASAGVSFYVVISMTQRFNGEARQVILAAMASNIRPKWVVIVDPDIDVHSSSEVEWAMAFRVQPQQNVIIVDQIPAGPSDPSIDDPTKPRPMRTASSIGIDATRPFGKPFSEVADVAGLGGLCYARTRSKALIAFSANTKWKHGPGSARAQFNGRR